MKRLLLLLLIVIFSSTLFGQEKSNHPNIVFILSDDHAYQAISAYGSKLMQTPNIDRIAREGALFRNVFVGNSLCAPSRATLLTGKYSHINGLKINDVSNPFNVNQELFPRILQQNNYQTAWIGKWHLQTLPAGFDFWKILSDQGEYYNPDFINMGNDTVRHDGYVTDVITDITFDFFNHRDTSKPFCIIIGEKATHREWLPDLQDLGAFDKVNFPMPPNFRDDYMGRPSAHDQDMTIEKTMRLKEDLKVHPDYIRSGIYNRFTEDQKKIFSAYYEKISTDFDAHHFNQKELLEWKYQRYMNDYLSTAKSLDRNIGKILDYLDRSGLAANTVVIYASDQGFYLGEHGWFDKRFMYEESLRTPMVMRYPGKIKPGAIIPQMIMNIDFAPTLLEIAGLSTPQDMQGQSFLPLLKVNSKATWRDAIYYHYYEFPQPHHVSPHFGIRTNRYKLIRFYKAHNNWELYDLQNDRHEMKNLYGRKGMEAITKKLKNQLNILIGQYKDTEAMEILTLEKQ